MNSRGHIRLQVLWFMAICLVALVVGPSSYAHTIRPAIVEANVSSEGRLTLSIETNLEALLSDIGPEHTDTNESPNAQRYNALRDLSPKDLEVAFSQSQETFLSLMSEVARVDGEAALALDFKELSIPPVGDIELARKSVITLEADLPIDASRLEWAYPESYGSNVLRVMLPDSSTPQSFWLQAGEVSPPVDLTGLSSPPSIWSVMGDYIIIGFTHILPLGLDHILFVLGIFLLSLRLAPILWQVTAFTIAHTITLGMSIYGLISLSPSIVEPLIAISIVYVGVENILTKELKPWRILVVFLFGLLHGMGFAGVLSEIGLPEGEFLTALITFNIGVELGQLAVIALAFLCVGWFRHESWYRPRIVIPASAAISLIGAYWAIERIFF